MLQNLPPYNPRLPHHQSLGNLSEGNISDTISESSDNATLLSLSRDDLLALGAGNIREDVRVNRKKLENLILRERENTTGKHYMEVLMERTNTYVQWPSRMKIGAKTKKDLYIRVYGHNQDEVNDAKNQILNDLGPHRDLRITLKMEISYTDHSHLIGCRGQTIRKVMDDTGCHIHFPDSNRMSKEHKSNQVTIAGSSVVTVEQARARVRELSPLVFQFSLPAMHSPYDIQVNPDANHLFIENIQANYGVQVTIHPPNKLQQTSVSVKGCEIDASAVREAVAKIIAYFSNGNILNNLQVESTMEISSIQHQFVRGINDSNVHTIMMNTGAKIIFPDLTDGNIQHIKRSRVYITGEMNCVYNARQQLLGCLPLRMIFDLQDDYPYDWEPVRQIAAELNVNAKMINRNRAGDRGQNGAAISGLPPQIPGRSRTIQLIAHERNTSSMFEVRRRFFGSIDPVFNAAIPQTYYLRPAYTPVEMKGTVQYGNRLGPPITALPPLLMPTSPNIMSPVLSPSFWPPTPFSSPFCSPPIATCVVSGGNSNNMNMGNQGCQNNSYGSNDSGMGMGPGQNGHPPGIRNLTLDLRPRNFPDYNTIYGSLPSPSPINPNPPEISINSLKQSFHLPLLHPHAYNQQHPDSALNTPMSLGGTSIFSDLSPMAPNHPGVGMVDALINDSMDYPRRAPGFERANTAPNLFSNLNISNSDLATNGGEGGVCGGSSGSNGGSRSESPTSGIGSSVASSGATTHSSDDASSTLAAATEESKPETKPDEKVANPMNEKKYMAVKAMYQEKIGRSFRVPNSEWSGCGFSKTYTNLFPSSSSDSGAASTTTTSSFGARLRAERDSGNNGGSEDNQTNDGKNKTDHGNGDRSAKDVQRKTHNPLGHQQSNLLDFAATRPNTDKPATDLASLFIQNGLEKYIDKFISEEIDLDTFSTLNEGDLRSLGVSAYPARKRMLVLITQISCPRPDQDWNNN